jgi:AcrR family transcriptional regulator
MKAARKGKARALLPRKTPVQRRSRETFDALVGACTWLLPRLGYAGTTTNHIAERAGVNIGSLYEYFPGKDAIVAQVAEGLVERVLSRLSVGAARVLSADEDTMVARWVGLIHDTVAAERDLVAVFLNQVPYTNDLAPIRDMSARLFAFSEEAKKSAGHLVRQDLSPASLHLLINLVTSTILQVLLNPPRGIPRSALMSELTRRVEDWIRPRKTARPNLT